MRSTERVEGGPAPASVIERISLILDCFSQQDPSLSVGEIASRAGLPKSTTSRLVAALAAQGFLEHQDGELALGLRFFELGEKASRPRNLRRLTYAHMEGLRRVTGHTVHLAVLDGRHVVYIEILPARGTPALPSRVGGRVLAHATAVGKALLAFSPPALTEQLIVAGLRPVGPRTIVDADELRAALWRIRAAGIATEEEESAPGVACVAAPILVDDRPIAAISISGLASEIDIAASVKVLARTTKELNRQAAGLPASRRTM